MRDPWSSFTTGSWRNGAMNFCPMALRISQNLWKLLHGTDWRAIVKFWNFMMLCAGSLHRPIPCAVAVLAWWSCARSRKSHQIKFFLLRPNMCPFKLLISESISSEMPKGMCFRWKLRKWTAADGCGSLYSTDDGIIPFFGLKKCQCFDMDRG